MEMFMQCMILVNGHFEDVLEMTEYNGERAAAVNSGNQGEQSAKIGLANAGNEFIIESMIARQANWQNLSDTNKHSCLQAALMQVEGN
jgi:hypothetical protein